MEINCDFAVVKESVKNTLGHLYTCKISSVSIEQPNQEVKSFTGQHESEKSDYNVEAIWFNCTQVHYMPRGLNKIFPNLKAVRISNCGLKEISRADLFGLKNISGLFLNNNELSSLPDDLLVGLNKLKWVNFNSNKLEFFSSQLLQPVIDKKLIFAGFFNNPVINVGYDKNLETCGSYADLPRLLKIMDEKCMKDLPDKKVDDKPVCTNDKKRDFNEPAEDFNANLTREIQDLWTSGFLSDYTIIVGDKKFKVHKNVLAIQSKFFKEMFKSDASSVTEFISEVFSAETVERVLRWMYTGMNPDTKNAFETFSLCTKLEISKLLPVAEDLVLKSLNEKNVMEIFELGHLHNSDRLKKFAYEKIKENLKEPDLNGELMENVEELKKLVQVKRTCDEMLKKYKKQKKN